MTHNNLTKELVTRSSQLSFYKYIGVLPNPDKLFTRYGKTYQTYRELKNDPHLWACIQSRKSGVLSRKHEILQGNSNATVYDFVRSNFENIDIQRLVRQMLDTVLMGFQVFEIIWQQRYFNGNTIYAVKDIEARPQEYFYFDVKGNLQLKSHTESPHFALPRRNSNLPPFKTLLLQHEADYENPYGQPLLSKCYWVCTFKNTALRFWINFIEKFGMPTIIASADNALSDAEAQSMMDTLLQMQEQNTLLASNNLDIKLHENNKSGNVELYRELINLCNAEISKVILSSTLTTEIDSGSYAAAKTHQEVRQDVVESDLELIEKGMNALIATMCELNFGAEYKPVFAFL